MCLEYKILSKKGEGTFSEVVKGQSLEDGSLVAIKRMKGKFQRSPAQIFVSSY
jgi:renal tumor antigen